MPTIGEVRTWREINHKATSTNRCIWHACISCGKERWVQLYQGKPRRQRCRACANKCPKIRRMAENAPGWKGGRYLGKTGYVYVYVPADSFWAPMRTPSSIYAFEHRLVMGKHLGRCLQLWEIVHHKGIRYKGIRNRSDNLLDNLQLVTDLGHKQITILERKIDSQANRITEIEAELALIRGQLERERKGSCI